MPEMRQLTNEEIAKLANRKNVRKIAVENFLGTMGTNSLHAWANLQLDTRLYKWKAPTVKAIHDGIVLAQKPPKGRR